MRDFCKNDSILFFKMCNEFYSIFNSNFMSKYTYKTYISFKANIFLKILAIFIYF